MARLTQNSGSEAETNRKVFIVEDHPFFREGLVSMLNREPGFIVCGQAGDAETALQQIPEAQPDLVLVDISLPGRNGLELIKELRVTDKEVKILVISMHDKALYADRVLRAGGNGYIMKDEDPEELAQAMRDVLNGRLYISEEVLGTRVTGNPSKTPTRPLDALTDEELELLELLGKGESESGMAAHLGITPTQVQEACDRVLRKLNLADSQALLRYAVCWVETGRC